MILIFIQNIISLLNNKSLAQSSQYDQEGVIDIIRQYADHLYGYFL